MTTDPADRMAEAVQQIAQRLAPLETLAAEGRPLRTAVQRLAPLIPLAYVVLALMVAATGLGTWLIVRASQDGHAALVKLIDQSTANQAEMLRRLHPQP